MLCKQFFTIVPYIDRVTSCGRAMLAPTISRVIQHFKGSATKQFKRKIWQKSFSDHVIRNNDDYVAHAKYINENALALYFKNLENKNGD